MNVTKNEFFSKQKKLRLRGQKNSKSNLLGYHTVSHGLPVPFSKALLGLEDSGKSSDIYKASMTSRLESDTDMPAELKNLIESISIISETDASAETVTFGGGERNSNSYAGSDSEGSFSVRHKYARMISNSDSLSEETSYHSFGTDESSIEDLTQGLIKKNRSATTNGISKGYLRDRSISTKTQSIHHSAASVKNYGNTPCSKSTRSTPKTSGSGRINSADNETEYYILAVTEGRGQARGEVGIAAIDPRRPQLILCQISDNQRYIHSLTTMSVFNFVEVIMPNTFIDGSSASKLYLDIREYFPRATIMSIHRRHFSETVGLELISQYSSPESGSIMVQIRDKFYALSAAAALIRYVEYSQNILFAPRSVKVEFRGTGDSMLIDLNAANRLELVVSSVSAESKPNNTLLGVLKHCRTKGGTRLLRANILQPPFSLSKIKMRLDCVTELIKKPLFFFALESAISGFANVENLLSLCMHEPQQDGLRAAEFQLKYVLLLKTILEQLPMLKASLEEGTCEFYSEVRQNLTDAKYKIILERILQVVPENVKSSRGSLSAHLHSCFAIKTGINGLLDIAKKTYCEIVQEIWDLISSLRDKHNLPLKMSFSVPRGFHIQFTPERNVKVDLPKQFILVQKAKSTYYFYTPELVALDQRCQQVLDEVKIMSNVILYELLNDIRQNIGCLFNLCEYVAELDVIVGFAHVSSGQNYVRPEFGDVLNIVESRHPILDVIHEGKIISNDIFAEHDRNFSIITGPNQSGKSIYIGQIALLQIMAQIGCYVPAKEASFRLSDRLFFRVGCDDSAESTTSTLIAEMQEMEYLKQTLTANSLVLIDELCRGTSVEEGTSLAFVICEELLDSTAFIFITTHYMLLTKLEELYCNVTNHHFDSQLIKYESGMSLRFSHKKLPGVTEAERYGLHIAQQTSFPTAILAMAKNIAEKLTLQRKPLPEVSGLAALFRISQRLKTKLREASPDLIAPSILHFKTMRTALGFANDHNCEGETSEVFIHRRDISTKMVTNSPKNLKVTSGITQAVNEMEGIKETHNRTRSWKMKRQTTESHLLGKRIKRKYELLILRNKHIKSEKQNKYYHTE